MRNRFAILLCAAVFLPIRSFASENSVVPYSWDDSQKRVLEYNAEVLAARESLRASEARKAAAFAGFLPTFKASLGLENAEREGVSQVPVQTGTNWTAGLTGSLNLFSGFLDSAKLAQAEADRRAAEASWRSALAKVQYDLTVAFEAAAFARDSIKLSAQIVKRRDENLRLVQLRFESGRENKGSLLLSEAYLEQARYDDLQSRNAASTSSASLAKLFGVDNPDEKIGVIGHVPWMEPPNSQPDFSSLVEQTPEYQQALQQRNSSREAKRIVAASFWPSLDLTTSVNRRGTEFFPDNSTTRSTGITLSIPLFSGGDTLNQYRAAKATEQAAEFTFRNTVRELRRKLESVWMTYVESSAKLRADESFLRAAQVRSEVARTKYNSGLLSFEDWDLIENDLINRQKAALISRRDRTTAEAAWQQAIGKGIEP